MSTTGEHLRTLLRDFAGYSEAHLETYTRSDWRVHYARVVIRSASGSVMDILLHDPHTEREADSLESIWGRARISDITSALDRIATRSVAGDSTMRSARTETAGISVVSTVVQVADLGATVHFLPPPAYRGSAPVCLHRPVLVYRPWVVSGHIIDLLRDKIVPEIISEYYGDREDA